ncbi:MAG: hypothetical protein IH588_20215 [Anaerolineales bacterium]|nr:hypothetical protein [Anaerolineales bacterium]
MSLTVLACGLVSPASSTPTIAPVEATVPVPLAGLTAEQIRNAQYQLGARDDHAVVQLTDGQYQHGTDATTMDFAYVGLLSDFISIGDLTGDGVDEAAAIFVENYGGTGNFAFVTVYTNVNGLPVFSTSTLIDDRPMVNSVSIENSEVLLDAVIHGVNDGGCCPTLPTTRRYALVNNQLRIVHYTTDAPTGARREIEIVSPSNEAEASGSVQVTGNISIAPFENNLSYFIYDEAGNELALGPVSVAAPDFGAPGTFDLAISLEGIPAGTIIYLEIQDISAADGSWLAMDAVKLFIK